MRFADSVSAWVGTRQEAAPSRSARTHCAITERIYDSYSFDVFAGDRSIADLIASSCASEDRSSTAISVLFRTTTIGPSVRTGAASAGRAAVRQSKSGAVSAA